MAAAHRTNNTEQLQRFINNLWQHQKKSEFCDFTLTTNNTSIECHKLVLSSASPYFSKLLCYADYIDVTPLPEHILRTAVAFMYNSEYVIDDENAVELLKLSITWNLDILAKLCMAHITNNDITDNDVNQNKLQHMNEFQTNNQQTSVEDINSCLELTRSPHISEATLHHVNKTSIPEVKQPRYWRKSGIYYIGLNSCMYQYVSKAGNPESVKVMDVPDWVDRYSSVASYRTRVVIAPGWNYMYGSRDKRAVVLDMTDNTKVTQLPAIPESRGLQSVVLADNDVYVLGGYYKRRSCISPVYYLSLGSDAWQAKESMPQAVERPLVIQHQQYIYVLGGSNTRDFLSAVSQYNIKDDTWKRCSDMPVACSSQVAGVVVHEGRIKVFTPEQCLMYDDDTDNWTVKYYSKLGHSVKALVRSGQICAAVIKGEKCSMMCYDDVENVWTVEHNRIDHAWFTCLFC